MKKILVTGLVIVGLALVFAGCTEVTVPIPSNPEELCNKGWKDLIDGDATSAQTNFEAALEIDSAYTNAWNGLGWVAITRDDFESAFRSFSYAKQTIGNPLDQDTPEKQNLYFKFYMDAYFGSGLTFYMAGDFEAEYYDMAYGEFEIACKADSEADDPDLGDYWDDDFDYEWNYVNWYMKDGDDYYLTTWHVHLYAAMAYLKADTGMDKAVAHINLCRERVDEDPDFTAGDWQDVNNEIDRLMDMNPDPDMLNYPYGYPNIN
ncbi:hypothetical protein KAU45_05675 [bacterium]|nr:hypothetical protein [bacterium]